MDRLAFTSLAAVNNQSEIRAQITNNLANVSTVGFKESFALASQTVDVKGDGFESRASVAVDSKDIINLMPGVPNQTGRAMDIAMQAATVLGVQADNGEIGFTRRGDLRVSPTGLIENAAGHLVLGEAGPINIPPGQLVTISPDGTVFGSLPSEPAVAPIRSAIRSPDCAQLYLASYNSFATPTVTPTPMPINIAFFLFLVFFSTQLVVAEDIMYV